MEDRRKKSLTELLQDYLYEKNMEHFLYNDIIKKDLILYSNPDNDRPVPSVVDGLKPEQRKVLFTCFTHIDQREVNVAELSGSVAEMSAYHHEESSLMMTFINLALNFVGSTNINLLQPLGPFGTGQHGGKDAASPQHIFTVLSSLTRLLFPSLDDNVLKFIYDDNQKAVPEWYIPIIPMVLANGAEGICNGWAWKIPSYDVRELVNNIHRMLDGEEANPMLPSYKNSKGVVQKLGPDQYILSGKVSVLDKTTIEISELAVPTWIKTYKEQMLEPMLRGTKKIAPLIVDYNEYYRDTAVRYIIKMTEKMLAEVEAAGLHEVFNFETPLTCNSMMLLDHTGWFRSYETVQDILQEFFELRLYYYGLRKDWLLGLLTAEASKLSNQARFILEKIEGKILIGNKPKEALIQLLVQRGYDPDPVNIWKQDQLKEEAGGLAGEDETGNTTGPDYNYVLDMPMWNLTEEKKNELGKQRDIKMAELEELKRKSPSALWKGDLAAFIQELDRVEAKEREGKESTITGKVVKGKSGRARVKKMQPQEIKKKVKCEKREFGEDEDTTLPAPEQNPDSMPKPVKRARNKTTAAAKISSDCHQLPVAKKPAKNTKPRKRKTSNTDELDAVIGFPKKSTSAKKSKSDDRALQ